MKRIPREIYTPKFQERALRLHEIDGLIVPEMSNHTSVLQGTLNYWIYTSRRWRLAKRVDNRSAWDICHLPPSRSDYKNQLAAFSIIAN